MGYFAISMPSAFSDKLEAYTDFDSMQGLLMKSVTFLLPDILREIKSGTYVILRIQRNFAPDTATTCRLIDTIARNYPTVAVLALPAEAMALPCSAIDWANAIPVSVAPPGSFYILDGQQQLTSIARAFGADATHQYLFDLNAIYTETASGGMCLGKDWVVCKENQTQLLTDVALVRCVDALLAGTAYSKVLAFLHVKFPDDSRGELTRKSEGLLEVLESVRNYKIQVLEMERDEPLGSVARYFETNNNTEGQRETTDLIRWFRTPQ